MRRVILAITATVAGLVALLSFKSHAPSVPSAAAPLGAGGAAGAPAPSSSSSPGQGQGFTTGTLTNLPAGERAVTGAVANTAYGPVQVQLVVRSNKIVKVSVLKQPTATIHDIQIGQFAFPRLIGETLAAQNAKIDAVSGASYTSQGYIQSLQSAVDRGALLRRRSPSPATVTAGQIPGSGRLRHAEEVMGTVVSFDVPAWTAGDHGALAQAVRWLHWVDATFSPYRQGSDVSRFGRGSLPLAECAPELAEVLAACAAVSKLSGGYFTATPGGRFDPSGYVKGWAIERAAAMLTAAGSAEHSVNGGGDVQCVGERASGQPWRIGIAHPLRPGTLALVVTGRDFAVATSGIAERGAHIVNPHTGQLATGLASITVIGPGLALTDAYATAAFAMGPAARDWVESLSGVEAFAITPQGAAWQTTAFRAYLP